MITGYQKKIFYLGVFDAQKYRKLAVRRRGRPQQPRTQTRTHARRRTESINNRTRPPRPHHCGGRSFNLRVVTGLYAGRPTHGGIVGPARSPPMAAAASGPTTVTARGMPTVAACNSIGPGRRRNRSRTDRPRGKFALKLTFVHADERSAYREIFRRVLFFEFRPKKFHRNTPNLNRVSSRGLPQEMGGGQNG